MNDLYIAIIAGITCGIAAFAVIYYVGRAIESRMDMARSNRELAEALWAHTNELSRDISESEHWMDSLIHSVDEEAIEAALRDEEYVDPYDMPPAEKATSYAKQHPLLDKMGDALAFRDHRVQLIAVPGEGVFVPEAWMNSVIDIVDDLHKKAKAIEWGARGAKVHTSFEMMHIGRDEWRKLFGTSLDLAGMMANASETIKEQTNG